MRKGYNILLLILIMVGCKKPYNPLVISTDNSFLVVEGLINTGQDSTSIKLSRTVKLSSTNTTKPELNAVVTVEGDQNSNYALPEAGNGIYSSPPLNLSLAAKYRLRIKTTDGKEYLSDYVEAKITPGIDSLSFHVENNGVQFYVAAHDPQNKTRYYRWDFSETYKYIAAAQSSLKLGPNGLPVYRTAYIDSLDNIYQCYKTIPSHQVLLNSTAKLGQDIVTKQPIDFVAGESGKVSHGYGLLVRQYALTVEGFNYWQILKKNTEQLGSIFDAQPSSLQGNIHCTTNPDEPVIGFVSASDFKLKRLYVDPTELFGVSFPNYIPPPPVTDCESKFIPIAPEGSFQERLKLTVGSGDSVLLEPVQPIGAPAIIGYSYVQKECADCRAKAPFGTNVKPAFFPSY